MKLSTVVITLNEEENIEPCLLSVSFADEVIVVDGGSTDRTVEKAKKAGAIVFEIPFVDFASQKNHAIGKASHEWIFLIDADERVTDELAGEIQAISHAKEPSKIYRIRRITYFLNKRMRFGGAQDDRPIRLFPKGSVRYEQLVHEEIVSSLPVGSLCSPMIHCSTRNLAHYQEKLKRYIPLEKKLLEERGASFHYSYAVMRACLKFVFLFFGKLGCLDGLTGLNYALLSSYYEYLKHSPQQKVAL